MSTENLYTEDDSLPVGVDRHAGPVVLEATGSGPLHLVDQTNSELNGQLSVFLEQKTQLHSEVAPAQPEDPRQQEYMVNTTTEQPFDKNSKEEETVDHYVSCVTEESEPSSAEGSSKMLPNTGYGQVHAGVSKDWVMNQIDGFEKKMQAQFDELSAQVKGKEKELDDCHIEIDEYQSLIQELEEKLRSEVKENEALKQEKRSLEQQLKIKGEKVSQLKLEIVHLRGDLEKAKKSGDPELVETIKSQLGGLCDKVSKSTKMLEEMKLERTASSQGQPSENLLSPIQTGHFHFLSDRRLSEDQVGGERFTICPSLDSSMSSSMSMYTQRSHSEGSHDDSGHEEDREPHDSDVD